MTEDSRQIYEHRYLDIRPGNEVKVRGNRSYRWFRVLGRFHQQERFRGDWHLVMDDDAFATSAPNVENWQARHLRFLVQPVTRLVRESSPAWRWCGFWCSEDWIESRDPTTRWGLMAQALQEGRLKEPDPHYPYGAITRHHFRFWRHAKTPVKDFNVDHALLRINRYQAAYELPMLERKDFTDKEILSRARELKLV